jgi:capping protein (actin filament) muscle Z-line, alpha
LIRKSILKSLSVHATEHYPASTIGVFPIEHDTKIAILLVANKYSPNNFWNGRWRSSYIFDPSASSLSGTVKVDVHYYEDGNVRLLTKKTVEASTSSSASGAEIVKAIAAAERKYQEELNRGFTNLSEGAFKSLRRQLPVTRQKIEWSKVTSYRIGYVQS